MDNQSISDKLKELVSLNKTEDAIQFLANQRLDDIEREIILLNTRFNRISEEIRLGVISDEDANLEFNKINLTIIELAEKLESRPPRPPIITDPVKNIMAQVEVALVTQVSVGKKITITKNDDTLFL